MIGKEIANYRIVEKLGEGGMGVVYKGIDTHLDRPVAIKMLTADLANNAELVERFRAEAKAQANLNHVNLATLYAFLVERGTAFMVMEFVEGETFEQIIRRGPIPPETALPCFKQALLGMGAAHRAGIVHRDIKPSNIMLNNRGIVKVMDFGIAKLVGTRGMTRTGMQIGTPAYMAPEQIQNRPVDMRTDIYALGITLYQMLSGQLPFDSGSDFDIMNSQVTLVPPPLTRVYPYAPIQYQNAVMKALEKDPAKRYQTVEEFGAALEHPESVPAPVSAPPVSPGMRPTVMETPSPAPVRAATVMESRTAAVRATSIEGSGVTSAQPAAQKGGWNSRYTIAAAGAGVAMILLAVLVFARKPAVVGVSQVTAPSGGSMNSPLVQQQAEITTGNPGNILGGPSASSPAEGDSASNEPPAANPPEPSGKLPSRPATPKKIAQSPDAGPSKDAPPANGGMSAKEVDELEHQIDQLSGRAAAINNSLDHLQRQQAASGYGLRGDMVAAQSNMQTNLSKAQNAMEHGDPVKAKKYADIASASADTLERFLGR